MPHATIAIFDKSEERTWKPGEILSPGARPILESLGCWPAFAECGFLESFGTRSAWGSTQAYDNDFVYSLGGNGWRLDRERFDAKLLTCAQNAGVEIHSNAVFLDSRDDGTHWRLQFRKGECRARFVVDASGRSAAFAVQRGARRMPDDRLAGVCVLLASENAGDTLIEAVENGWWYSASVPGGTLVASFMSDTDLIRDGRLFEPDCWNGALARTEYTRERLHGVVPKGSPAVFTAHSQHLSQVSGERWAAAGDAAMAFDPLSSQGILKALRSGKLASFAAVDFLSRGVAAHEKYGKMAEAEYAAYREAKAAYYSMERRWPDALFWKRRRSGSR
jgi:flavin-dependent dehydrogenase